MVKKLYGSAIQVVRGSALQTSTGQTKSELTRSKGGVVVSKARKAAAKKNPGLTKWRQAIVVYKKTAGIPKKEFTLSPTRGTDAYRTVRAIYERM
jgi:hypothetical protein